MLLPSPFSAASEEMLTITPSPLRFSNGTKARMVEKGPRTLVIRMRS